ncbi:hypothetical protein XPA_007525 [Xanthoria parietina]
MHQPLNCSDGSTALLTPGSQEVRMASTSAHLQSHTHGPIPERRIAIPLAHGTNNPRRTFLPARVSSTLSSHLLHSQGGQSRTNLPGAAMHYRSMYGIISPAWDSKANVLPAIFGSCVLPAAALFSAVLRGSRQSSRYLGTVAILVFLPGIQLQLRRAHWCKLSCWLGGKDPPIEPVSFGLSETSWIRLVATAVCRSVLYLAP